MKYWRYNIQDSLSAEYSVIKATVDTLEGVLAGLCPKLWDCVRVERILRATITCKCAKDQAYGDRLSACRDKSALALQSSSSLPGASLKE